MQIYAVFDNSFFEKKPWWILKKLHNVVCIRSNPRSKEYMLRLLQEHCPQAQLIDINMYTPRDNSQIILLYPDSIGLGWGSLEKKSLKKFQDIKVLNGRKRFFSFNHSSRRKLILRRFLEITFFLEFVVTPFLLSYAVFLGVKDKIKGRV